MGKLQCIYCGAPVDVKTGECTVCGKYVESVTHVRIVDVSELARVYGYTDDPDDEGVPELFGAEPAESDEAPPELLTAPSRRTEQRRSSAEQPAAETPQHGQFSGYLSRLDIAAGAHASREGNMPEPEQTYTVERTVGQKAARTQAEPKVLSVSEPVQETVAEDIAAPEPPSEQEPERVNIKERLPESLRGAYEKIWENGLRPKYIKIDRFLSPVTEKVVEWFRRKFPMPSRAKGNPLLDRMAVIGAGAAALVLIVMLIIGIASLFPENLCGEWVVSEELSVEFSLDGTVTSWVYVDGEPRVERQGTYTVRRKNGHNLLIIVYEDGVERRLYYDIEGDIGIFTNVDTNMQAQYTRA